MASCFKLVLFDCPHQSHLMSRPWCRNFKKITNRKNETQNSFAYVTGCIWWHVSESFVITLYNNIRIQVSDSHKFDCPHQSHLTSHPWCKNSNTSTANRNNETRDVLPMCRDAFGHVSWNRLWARCITAFKCKFRTVINNLTKKRKNIFSSL